MNSQASLPIKMVGGLCALVFALGFGLELLVLFQQSRSHQLLLSAFTVCLAIWAAIEAQLLQSEGDRKPLRRLVTLVSLQGLLLLGRAALLIFSPPEMMNQQTLLPAFLVVYALVFLAISQSIINFHSAKLEEAYQKIYEEQTAVAVKESRAAERERLLQDMHDGFGSQLASARMLAEHGTLKADRLADLLQECIADLYLFTDTLGHSENTLADGFADLRYRTEQRCGHLPIHWRWQLAFDGLPALSQRKSLQILRIAQEAINNALKHAHATEIAVEVEMDQLSGRLVLAVTDNGVGLPENLREGRGFSGMRQRAREISGQLVIARRARGTRVSLALFSEQ